MTSVQELEKKYYKTNIPAIHPGDTVSVHQRIKEGDKERIQQFEGLVLAVKHGRGLNGTITIRKISSGIGVERIFPIHSPTIEKIEMKKHIKKVHRSKLYFIRKKAAKEVRKRTAFTEGATEETKA